MKIGSATLAHSLFCGKSESGVTIGCAQKMRFLRIRDGDPSKFPARTSALTLHFDAI
jgi:hypothetical protein